MTRHRNWESIFATLGLYNGREMTDGFVLCNGVIGGKNVQYFSLVYSQSGGCVMAAYGYSGSIFNVVSEEFSYGNTPAATVDIIF